MNVRLDRLRALIERGQPLAPIHQTYAVRLTEVRAGHCTARMPAAALTAQLDPRSAGPLLVLADGALGVAVSSALPADLGITTLRLSLHLLAAWWPTEGWVTCAADADEVDDETGTSRAEVRDADGRLLATLDTRCAVLSATERRPRQAAPPPVAAPPEPTAQLTDDGPRTTLRARTGPAHGNARGAVQGGMLGLLADRLLTPLLADPGAGPLRHDLDVHYLRAAPMGADLVGNAERVHAGRRLRTARAVLSDDRGRAIVTASGLAYTGTAR